MLRSILSLGLQGLFLSTPDVDASKIPMLVEEVLSTLTDGRFGVHGGGLQELDHELPNKGLELWLPCVYMP